jgi:uncharacterized membrane protein
VSEALSCREKVLMTIDQSIKRLAKLWIHMLTLPVMITVIVIVKVKEEEEEEEVEKKKKKQPSLRVFAVFPENIKYSGST